MEKNQILLGIGVILVFLFIVSMTTTEGFYRDNTVKPSAGMPMMAAAQMGGPARPSAPTTQVTSAAQAAPVVSSASAPGVTPAPVGGALGSGPKKVTSASKMMTAPGKMSKNVVHGKSSELTPLWTLTFGINNGEEDVADATTAGAPLDPNVGSIQQVAAPGSDYAASNIQNKPSSGGSVLSPSALPADIQTATSTYMPTNPAFRPPASMLSAPMAPMMAPTHMGPTHMGPMMAPAAGSASSKVTSPMPRKPHHKHDRDTSSDDCDDCNQCNDEEDGCNSSKGWSSLF